MHSQTKLIFGSDGIVIEHSFMILQRRLKIGEDFASILPDDRGINETFGLTKKTNVKNSKSDYLLSLKRYQIEVKRQ